MYIMSKGWCSDVYLLIEKKLINQSKRKYDWIKLATKIDIIIYNNQIIVHNNLQLAQKYKLEIIGAVNEQSVNTQRISKNISM